LGGGGWVVGGGGGGVETVDERVITSVCASFVKKHILALMTPPFTDWPPTQTHSTTSWCLFGVWGGRWWFVKTGAGEMGHVRASLREIGPHCATLGQFNEYQ